MGSIRAGIDANVFIYVLEKHPEFFSAALNVLKLVETGDIDGVASELTLLEILSAQKLHGSQINHIQEFLQSTTVVFQGIAPDVLLEAARLRRHDPNLKTPDAIHIASAILTGATYFITNDQKLYKKQIKGIEFVPLAKAATLFTRGTNHFAP